VCCRPSKPRLRPRNWPTRPRHLPVDLRQDLEPWHFSQQLTKVHLTSANQHLYYSQNLSTATTFEKNSDVFLLFLIFLIIFSDEMLAWLSSWSMVQLVCNLRVLWPVSMLFNISIVSCLIIIQNGFTFLIPFCPCCPGKGLWKGCFFIPRIPYIAVLLICICYLLEPQHILVVS